MATLNVLLRGASANAPQPMNAAMLTAEKISSWFMAITCAYISFSVSLAFRWWNAPWIWDARRQTFPK